MISECSIISEFPKSGQKLVYLAEHPDLGKVVVKKAEIKSFVSLERIRREINFLKTIQSPYYPKQYHFNIDLTTNQFEIIEEYIIGQTLKDSVKSFNHPLAIFKLLSELIKGLSIIWERNIVHRDLKPENIIIRPDGKPCIIDLGIARFLDMESLTKTLAPFGPCTPIYAAPEQINNERNLIDHRTDFFCLGIVALELYLGVHPFDPRYCKNAFSIVENILQNIYILETEAVPQDNSMTELAQKTLQSQPFNRFRTQQMFSDFLSKKI